MKIIVLKVVGSISFALGVLGVFLPLLPSTCFILLSTWAFSKSSPKFHRWLYYQSPFSQSIQNWQQHRIVPRKTKVIATVSLIVSFAITAYVITNTTVLIALAAGMTGLLVYLLTRDDEHSVSEVVNSKHNHEWHPQVN